MFSIRHSDGSGDDGAMTEDVSRQLNSLFDELGSADREHSDVAVVNEDSGWCISAHRDGRVVFEHLRDGGERHMIPVARQQVLDLWRRLIDGDIAGLMTEPWKRGYV